MSKLKKTILYIIIILFISFCGLLLWYNRYNLIEKKYINAAKIIYEDNGIEDVSKVDRIIITRKEINYLLSKPILNNDCNGYVIIHVSNQGPTYDAYIKCKKYETKGFDSKFLD